MDKQEILDTINSLLACLHGDDTDVQTLIEIQLDRMEPRELEEYFREGELAFYINNPNCFKDAYYSEFIEA